VPAGDLSPCREVRKGKKELQSLITEEDEYQVMGQTIHRDRKQLLPPKKLKFCPLHPTLLAHSNFLKP